jgi:hypothetical protein
LTPVAAHRHHSFVPRPNLVRVAVAPDSVVAAMWQEALRRVGIPVVLHNRDALSVTWGTPAPSFSIELMVGSDDVESARSVLADLGAVVEA